jgi:hypothetical protein
VKCRVCDSLPQEENNGIQEREELKEGPGVGGGDEPKQRNDVESDSTVSSVSVSRSLVLPVLFRIE